MGLIMAFSGALNSSLADQWKDVITVGAFDEQMAVAPGLFITNNRGRGTNFKGSIGIISNGSKIFVPENTAAFIFDNSGIQEIVTQPGGYVYQQGESSIFAGDGIGNSIIKQTAERIGYGGMPGREIRVCFVNLRELRDIRFGTTTPIMYNDRYYSVDLRVTAYGAISIKIVDPVKFVREYLPANVQFYSFNDENARAQIINEFMQSFIVALGGLSEEYRISQIPSQAGELVNRITQDTGNAGTWESRFGFKLVNVSMRNIELTSDSLELVNQYNNNRMGLLAYENISKKASDIRAQQNITEGIKDHGFGDGAAGMIIGMNMAQGIGANGGAREAVSLDQQIETVKKLKDLLDAGILTEEEFNMKKKEILGL